METLTPVAMFLSGLGLTAALAMGCVLYLHRHLLPLLDELCGTRPRAAFWAAFSSLLLIIFPMVGALLRTPGVGPGRLPVFELGAQVATALVGLGMALVAIGLVLSSYIMKAAR